MSSVQPSPFAAGQTGAKALEKIAAELRQVNENLTEIVSMLRAIRDNAKGE